MYFSFIFLYFIDTCYTYDCCLFQDFDSYQDIYDDFDSGWVWIGRKQDVSDQEWRMWLKLLIYLVPCTFVHHLISQIIKTHSISNRVRNATYNIYFYQVTHITLDRKRRLTHFYFPDFMLLVYLSVDSFSLLSFGCIRCIIYIATNYPSAYINMYM